MKDATAIYLGQIVSKNNFRVFIYAPDGSQKLVESWDSFEKHMEKGLWFASKEDAIKKDVQSEKPKSRTKKQSNKTVDIKKQSKGVLGELGLETESNIDDFLPKSENK